MALKKQKKQVTEQVLVKDLKPHPRNYRVHLDDQLAHIVKSIQEHGFYRNVVIALDGTILAGHGVVQAAKKLGLERVPAYRLDIDPLSPIALKVLTGDNEISKLGEVDDRALTEMLKEIRQADGLLGTGFDEQMLAALAFVTRPASEIGDMNDALAWTGMPEYDQGGDQIKLVVTFLNEEDRAEFVVKSGLTIDKKVARTWATRWPFTEREDGAAIKFEEEAAA